MKKFLLGIILLVFTFNGISQTVIQQDWKIENPGKWASFYWGATRTVKPDSHGKYFYYVYFYSNSLFNTKKDGYHYDKAITYINDITITMDEYRLNNQGYKYHFNSVPINLHYVTCDWTYSDSYYSAWFWSYHPYAKFSLTFKKASAFDYSKY